MAGHHRIDQRSQHVEKRPHAQRPPHAAHALERRAEKRRVEVAHPASVETAAQAVDVVGKTHPVRFEDIGSPADRTGSVVPVFDHAVSRPGHHETRRSRYVERIFPVATRADDVDGLRSVQVDRHAAFQKGVPKPGKFLGSNAAHQEHGHEGRELTVVVLSVGNLERLRPGEIAVVEHLIKYFFHGLV